MPSIIKGEELKEYTVLDLEQQPIVNKSRAYSVEAGRGCPYGCSFAQQVSFGEEIFGLNRLKISYMKSNI